MALSTFERRQAAEISRLGAVGWSNNSGPEENNKEDFFDRAMSHWAATICLVR